MSSPSDPNYLDDLLSRFLTDHNEPSVSDLEDWLEDRAEVSPQVGKTVVTAFLARRDARSPDATPTLRQRLVDRFGSGVDPEIELDDEEPDESDPGDVASAQILSRLSGRGPASERYRLKGKVGSGGMGTVIRVWDEDLRRNLAMKVVLGKAPETETGQTPPVDSRQLSRFLEEAQITGQLSHPGIVPVHDLGLDEDGQVYFTMKLVKGQTLRGVFDDLFRGRGDWTRERVLGLLLKVCETLSYAHDKGVIHRDLKPDNVMIGKYGEVYVMDWGLARVASRDDQHDLRMQRPGAASMSDVRTERREQADADVHSPVYTMDGDIVGTPAYMPPEQSLGHVDAIGPHSDVYAIGAMLYQLLAGRMPYETPGSQVSAYMVLRWAREGPPRPLHELASDAPAELSAICDRAMEREIEHRYPNVSALRDDLQAFLEGRVVSAFETGAWAEARKWAQRNRGLASTLAAAVVMLTAGIILSYTFYRLAEASAVEARRQTDIATANEARSVEQQGIASANAVRALEQEGIASANEARALRQRTIANEQREEARRQERIAQEEKAGFDRLAVVVKLEKAEAAVADFDPAWPDKIEPMTRWLREEGTPLLGELPVVRETLRGLEDTALEQTAEEKRADREGNPRYVEVRKMVAAMELAMDVRNKKIEPSEAKLPLSVPNHLPTLRSLALSRVSPNPELRTWGEEALGLAYAKRALERAPQTEAHSYGNLLAWAYLANGMDEEARKAIQRVVETVPEAERASARGFQEKIDRSIFNAAHLLEMARKELEELATERRTWTFTNKADGFLHGTLRGVERDLVEFTSETGSLLAVQHRLDWAKRIRRVSEAHPRARVTWAAARQAIAKADGVVASELYAIRPVRLQPQLGLVPIGMNPETKLWEFYHLRSAIDPRRGGDPAKVEIPRHEADGTISVREHTGIVFVLIPGGTFKMGAQKGDPDAANYDPQARPDEEPHDVTLESYFLARHEMTQGQWMRLSLGPNPSTYAAGERRPGIRLVTLTHPVDNVSWNMGHDLLRDHGLSLPRESQWEYGCRGGTTSWWYPGNSPSDLEGHANLLDRLAKRVVPQWLADPVPFNDGHVVHAPVGKFKANAFGLHDVHGNVLEWCQEFTGGMHSRVRAQRGGGFISGAKQARSAFRWGQTATYRSAGDGVRPARTLR